MLGGLTDWVSDDISKGVGIDFRNVFDKNISPPVLNGLGAYWFNRSVKVDMFCTENNKIICLLYRMLLFLPPNKYISNKCNHPKV